MSKHRYAIRLSEAEAIKLYEKDIEKLQKQNDLLTLGLLQEKNKVTALEEKLKDMRFATSSKEYFSGYNGGLSAFAWWKNGIQYVGTCGTTLKQALKEVQ